MLSVLFYDARTFCKWHIHHGSLGMCYWLTELTRISLSWM